MRISPTDPAARYIASESALADRRKRKLASSVEIGPHRYAMKEARGNIVVVGSIVALFHILGASPDYTRIIPPIVGGAFVAYVLAFREAKRYITSESSTNAR